MSYYKTCPLCGATLDPGEVCACSKGKPMRELSPEECREQISAEADGDPEGAKAIVREDAKAGFSEDAISWFCKAIDFVSKKRSVTHAK